MTEFEYRAPAIGDVLIVRIGNGEERTQSLAHRIVTDYWGYEGKAITTTYVRLGSDDAILGSLHEYLSTSGSSRTIVPAEGISSSEAFALLLKSPRTSVDIVLTAQVLKILRLAIFCPIKFGWLYGFEGIAAATYEMYGSAIRTRPWRREKILYELSRRFPADTSVAVLGGRECQYVVIGSSPLLVDVVAAKMLGLPLNSIPYLSHWSKTFADWPILLQMKVPEEFRTDSVFLGKRIASSIVGHFSSLFAFLEDLALSLQRSRRNLYRIPAFIRTHMLRRS